MNIKSLIATVVGTIVKLTVLWIAVTWIYRGVLFAYDYGYRIFDEPPMSMGEGRDVAVTIPPEMKPEDMGELFYKVGLIRDARLFVLQYHLSEFKKELLPGNFTLNTSMRVEEMFEKMTIDPATLEEEEEGLDEENPTDEGGTETENTQ